MAMSVSSVSLKQHCFDHKTLQITTDTCQPWIDPYDSYFKYLIIPADYLIIELNSENFYWQ